MFGLTAQAASLGPLSLPGCSLLVTPDLVDVALSGAGSATFQLAIPDVGALVGIGLQHQVLTLELNGLGDIAAVTSTNALRLTIGSL